MKNIKEINPVMLLALIFVVFTTSYIGTSYVVSAQSQPIYYCKSLTDTIANPDTRYFQCSIDSSFSVLKTTAPYKCEISTDEPFCKNLTVPSAISNSLGGNYCNANGWSYYPSPSTPSSNFKCNIAPPSSTGAFDFSLLNGGTRSVSQGQSITNTITVTKILSVPTGLVTFNVSELPPESTASISPTSCTPSGSGIMTCATTINILTTALTPPGTYPVTIVGTSEVVNPGFPDQYATALGYCNGVTTSFYAKMSINNRYSSEASFSRTSFTKSCPTCNLDSAPDNFTVPANTILTKGGFGNITYNNLIICPAVPGDPYGSGIGSATYSVTVNGAVVDPSVIYSWNYAI
ncbi:MAG: hypothetical protein WCW03_01850 [Candidatus Paceibacterota bacterium]